jgi:uncharacterized protein (DUF302 family)
LTAYSIDRTLSGTFQVNLKRVKDALKAEGFGTLTEIDIQATLKEKVGKDMQDYTVLGVCNPQLASQAIDAEPKIGVFLPCTVLVRQLGNQTLVSAQDPILIEAVVSNPGLASMSLEASKRITRALDSLDA